MNMIFHYLGQTCFLIPWPYTYACLCSKWQKTPKVAITWRPEPHSQGTTAPLHHMECSTHHGFAAPETQSHPVLKSALSCKAHCIMGPCNILVVPASLRMLQTNIRWFRTSCTWRYVINCVVPTFSRTVMPPNIFLVYLFIRFACISYGQFMAKRYKFKLSLYV